MTSARVFALLSALMSLVYLACIPAVLICLFLNWRLAAALVPVGVIAAFLAKWLNGLKLRALHGSQIGSELNELDWKSGRRFDP